MHRRIAIRNVIILSAGAVLLPSCLHDDKASIPLKNISLKGSQEDMLAELAETIIPKTPSFIGAKDLDSRQFILTMVDDCLSPEDQKTFTAGMTKFEDECHRMWDTSFVKCTPQQRSGLLQSMEKKQDKPDDAHKFYGMVKHFTVQSFTSSRDYMINIRKYKMAPGPVFKGCVPVGKA